MGTLISNIHDTALIFEGGGMRASYTSGAVTVLLANQLYFDWVGGISAGSSCTANYVSRDATRAKRSFVDLAGDPNFGDLRTFVQGKGYFAAEWIYEQTSQEGQPLPFDWETFEANPARVRIGAVKARTGETVYWGRDDLTDMDGLLKRVRASSTMPILMPMPEIDGEPYVDGALGTSGGIALDAARADGYEKFFIIRTRPRGYRKRPAGHARFYRSFFREYPAVADAILNRWRIYNDTCHEIEMLERSGAAYVFHPVQMSISNSEKRLPRLQAAYEAGFAQASGELERWRDFLGV